MKQCMPKLRSTESRKRAELGSANSLRDAYDDTLHDVTVYGQAFVLIAQPYYGKRFASPYGLVHGHSYRDDAADTQRPTCQLLTLIDEQPHLDLSACSVMRIVAARL
jgi:hypothetical protein